MTDTPQWHRYVRADLSDRPSDPRRVPLSSDALFWLVPPRARFKQAAIDLRGCRRVHLRHDNRRRYHRRAVHPVVHKNLKSRSVAPPPSQAR